MDATLLKKLKLTPKTNTQTNNLKKEDLTNKPLEWIYPNSVKNRCDADINITVSESQSYGQDYRMTITIKNDSHKKLSKTGRVQFAVRGDRLYFRGAPVNEKGYKLCAGSNDSTRYLYIAGKVLNLDRNVVRGSYKLQFDHQLSLPYIRLDKKI